MEYVMDPQKPPIPAPRPAVETLIARALRLRCPRCGTGKLFIGWFTMPERCSECRLKLERAPGYYLGSAYINYGLTAVLITVLYFALHFGVGWTNRQLTFPLMAVVVVFPLFSFRYARALWLALDCHFDHSVLAGEE
jgi:uncharacterized protein (DUF983 family)